MRGVVHSVNSKSPILFYEISLQKNRDFIVNTVNKKQKNIVISMVCGDSKKIYCEQNGVYCEQKWAKMGGTVNKKTATVNMKRGI